MSNLPATRPRHIPAGAPAEMVSFPDLVKRAETLSKAYGVVPKVFHDNPANIVLVGMRGAEMDFSLGYALENIDVIEGKAVPNAQARQTLIRKHGHEIRFTESTPERATVRARRREDRDDPNGWITFTYTIEDARRAELTALWVERKYRNQGDRYERTEKYVVGDVFEGIEAQRVASAPEWVGKEVEAGRLRSKDNWRKDPTSMCRAAAIRHISKMGFSDVMAGAGIEIAGAAAYGDMGDVDEAVQFAPDLSVIDDPQPQAGDDIVEGELVDDDEVGEPVGEAAGQSDHPTDDGPDEDQSEARDGVPSTAPSPPAGDYISQRQQQDFAVAAKAAGLSEDQRHAIVSMVTAGRTRTSTEVLRSEFPQMFRWLEAVLDESYHFVVLPDGCEALVPRSPEAGQSSLLSA